jgi:hypothetical protein
MTRTQFAVALAVLFAGGVVGGMLSDHLRGGAVAYAQEDRKPLQIDNLVVKRLTVLEGVTVQDGEASVVILPDGVLIARGRSTAYLGVSAEVAQLALDSTGAGDLAEFTRRTTDPDRKATRQFTAAASSTLGTWLNLSGVGTKEEVCLSHGPTSGPSISLHDRAGNMRVTIGSNDDGRWEVGVWNADGQGRTLTADR